MHFKYLGTSVDEDGGLETKIKNREEKIGEMGRNTADRYEMEV